MKNIDVFLWAFLLAFSIHCRATFKTSVLPLLKMLKDCTGLDSLARMLACSLTYPSTHPLTEMPFIVFKLKILPLLNVQDWLLYCAIFDLSPEKHGILHDLKTENIIFTPKLQTVFMETCQMEIKFGFWKDFIVFLVSDFRAVWW